MSARQVHGWGEWLCSTTPQKEGAMLTQGNSCLSLETVDSMLQSVSLTAQHQYAQLRVHSSSFGHKYFVRHALLNKYQWQTLFSSTTSASQTFWDLVMIPLITLCSQFLLWESHWNTNDSYPKMKQLRKCSNYLTQSNQTISRLNALISSQHHAHLLTNTVHFNKASLGL
jgi:hypothetical protein